MEIGFSYPAETTILGVCWRPVTESLSFAIAELFLITFKRRGLLGKLESTRICLTVHHPGKDQAE